MTSPIWTTPISALCIRSSPNGKLFTAEAQAELDLLKADIEKYQEETICRWICGQGDVEAEWADYLATLKSMGHERYIEIYQEAFNATK